MIYLLETYTDNVFGVAIDLNLIHDNMPHVEAMPRAFRSKSQRETLNSAMDPWPLILHKAIVT